MSFLPLADVEINNETQPFWDALRNNADGIMSGEKFTPHDARTMPIPKNAKRHRIPSKQGQKGQY